MRTAAAVAATVVVLIVGCDDSPSGLGIPSLEDFSALSPFEELDYRGVTPGGDYDYWELRLSVSDGYHILGSGGSKSKAELDPDVLEAFERNDEGAVYETRRPRCERVTRTARRYRRSQTGIPRPGVHGTPAAASRSWNAGKSRSTIWARSS